MVVPSSTSIEEFAHGFKDIAYYNDVIEVDNISLYGSDSEEDQQPIDLPKGKIPVPIIEAISPPVLLYSYLIESLRKQLPRPAPYYLLLGPN